MDLYELVCVVAVVETDRERNDIPGYHICVNLVLQINVWLVLKDFEIGRRKIGQRMLDDCSCIEAVTECNQGSIQHLHIEAASLLKLAIDVAVSHVFQSHSHSGCVVDCDLERTFDIAMRGRKILLV